MPNRYYCPDLAAAVINQSITLHNAEAHHLIHVMRQHVGDTVELFDGTGRLAYAVISNHKKGYAELSITHLEDIHPEQQQSHITVAAVIPKSDRFRWMIEKLTELGIDQFIPLTSERSVVTPREGKFEKMQQTVIAAMKQSKRLVAMKILPVCHWSSLLEQAQEFQHVLIADPAGEHPTESTIGKEDKLLICIGPEGGFTENELQSAQNARGQLISLGNAILRTETAAIAAAAYYQLNRM